MLSKQFDCHGTSECPSESGPCVKPMLHDRQPLLFVIMRFAYFPAHENGVATIEFAMIEVSIIAGYDDGNRATGSDGRKIRVVCEVRTNDDVIADFDVHEAEKASPRNKVAKRDVGVPFRVP